MMLYCLKPHGFEMQLSFNFTYPKLYGVDVNRIRDLTRIVEKNKSKDLRIYPDYNKTNFALGYRQSGYETEHFFLEDINLAEALWLHSSVGFNIRAQSKITPNTP